MFSLMCTYKFFCPADSSDKTLKSLGRNASDSNDCFRKKYVSYCCITEFLEEKKKKMGSENPDQLYTTLVKNIQILFVTI